MKPLKESMSDLRFHVYGRKNKVKAINISHEELEDLIKTRKFDPCIDEVVPVLDEYHNEDASY